MLPCCGAFPTVGSSVRRRYKCSGEETSPKRDLPGDTAAYMQSWPCSVRRQEQGAHPEAPEYPSSAGQVTSNGTMTESLSKPESGVTSCLAVACKQPSWRAQPEAFSSLIFLGCRSDWPAIESATASRVCLLRSSQVSTLGNSAGSILRIFQLNLSHSVTWYPSSLWKPS